MVTRIQAEFCGFMTWFMDIRRESMLSDLSIARRGNTAGDWTPHTMS